MHSPLQLHISGTKYLLPLELHHHSTVSNTTLKPAISPFHEIPTHLATAHTSDLSLFLKLFDTHRCHMGIAIKHPVLCQIGVKPSCEIFDIWALWRSCLSVRMPRCQKLQMIALWHPGTLTLMAERQSARMSKISNDSLTPIWHSTGCFIAVPIWQRWVSKG